MRLTQLKYIICFYCFKNNMSDPNNWIALRQATIVPVFLSFLMNFITQWLAKKSNDEQTMHRISKLHRKLFVYGLGSLLAANLLQGGVFEAIWSWVIFLGLIFVHVIEFRQIELSKRVLCTNFYNLFIVIWYISIVIHFFI